MGNSLYRPDIMHLLHRIKCISLLHITKLNINSLYQLIQQEDTEILLQA